jgi:hypothetical protein
MHARKNRIVSVLIACVVCCLGTSIGAASAVQVKIGNKIIETKGKTLAELKGLIYRIRVNPGAFGLNLESLATAISQLNAAIEKGQFLQPPEGTKNRKTSLSPDSGPLTAELESVDAAVHQPPPLSDQEGVME